MPSLWHRRFHMFSSDRGNGPQNVRSVPLHRFHFPRLLPRLFLEERWVDRSVAAGCVRLVTSVDSLLNYVVFLFRASSSTASVRTTSKDESRFAPEVYPKGLVRFQIETTTGGRAVSGRKDFERSSRCG